MEVGAAIYNDGNEMTLRVLGSLIENNHANEGGAANFFVSNNRTGHVIIEDSVLRNNPSDGFGTPGFPGIFYLGDGRIQVTNSTYRMKLFIVALVLFGGVLPPGGTFTDDDGNPHEAAIEAIAAESITKGCNPPANTRYCPRDTVDRGAMAAFIDRALNLPHTNTDYFTDDNNSIFETSDQPASRSRHHQRLQPTSQHLVLPQPAHDQRCDGRHAQPSLQLPGIQHRRIHRRRRPHLRKRHPSLRRSRHNQRLQPTIQHPVLPQPHRHQRHHGHIPHQSPQPHPNATTTQMSELPRRRCMEHADRPPPGSLQVGSIRLLDRLQQHPASRLRLWRVATGLRQPDRHSFPGSARGRALGDDPLRRLRLRIRSRAVPIPLDAPIEGGSNGTGDRHVIVVDRFRCELFELFDASPGPGSSWTAASGARFDLTSSDLRPEGWTSADAAGLPIYPGLITYDEVASGEITHAIRFTAPQTQAAHVWPARHDASNSNDVSLPPMGQRFRMKASFDISSYSPEVQVILTAFKKYGSSWPTTDPLGISPGHPTIAGTTTCSTRSRTSPALHSRQSTWPR